jgi:hypothetical protein
MCTLLAIHSREIKSDTKVICMSMFIAALLIIAKMWNLFRCSSPDIWIKKNVVHTHTHKYYSAIKTNAFYHFQQNRWNWKIY